METKKFALITFYDKDKNITLQDRKSISKYGELYGLFGGTIEQGETPSQAIVREIREELNFDLIDFEYVGCRKYCFEDKYNVSSDLYIAKLENNLEKFKVLEGDGLKLCSLEKAKELSHKYDKDIIEIYKKFLLNK